MSPAEHSQSVIATMTNYTVPSLPPSVSWGDGDFDYDTAWYGNIQYLVNISAIGALTCLLIFILIKLRSDHRRMPGPTAIVSKLLAAWHATGLETARHCGADAAQFLLIEGGRLESKKEIEGVSVNRNQEEKPVERGLV